MKNIYALILLFFPLISFAQLVPANDVNVGGGSDFTLQPFVPQAKFSRTQTIYYPDQLQFNGEILGIRFFKPFSNPTTSPMPNPNLVFKIGHTTKNEYTPGDNFIPDSDLTQIGISTYFANAIEYIVIFDQPFIYNGTDNLIIDFEDINPAFSNDATDGFKGAENFNNPPTRSMVSITEEFDDGSTTTSTLYQNSYAQTQFDGNLQVCTPVFINSISNVTNSSADFSLNENTEADAYRYVITELGEDIPDTFTTTTSEEFSVVGLLPSKDYRVNVKSDCDAFGISVGYNSYGFKTRPNLLTVPYFIDFESDFNFDYSIPSFGADVNEEAANNSSNGLMFNGPGFPEFQNWNDFGNPFEENTGFIRTFSIDVDLTQNTTNPILKFDISQNLEAFLRVKVKAYADDSILTGLAEDFVYNATADDNAFKTVTIDLSPYVGDLITIKLEHVSRNFSRKTYLDNIRIIENDCDNISNVVATTDQESINITWDATLAGDYEVVLAEFDEFIIDSNYIAVDANEFTFDNLTNASPYRVYVRNKCSSSESAWQKIYASTNPQFLEPGYNILFEDYNFSEQKFSIQHNESSKAEIVTYFLNDAFVLFQRDSRAEWVGGTSTTESQAWNDNKDFLTGLKFLIDGTTLSEGSIDLSFKLYHRATSVPTHSWFRIMVNGQQFGPSYNPTTKNSDPFTDVNIDLGPYLGDIIEFELQQVGWFKGDFSLSAISGDGTELGSLTFNGTTLSTETFDNNAITLSPNPVKDILTIRSETVIRSLSVFDINGRKIKSQNIDHLNLKNYSLDLQSFSNGVYFIEVHSAQFKQTLKVIKD